MQEKHSFLCFWHWFTTFFRHDKSCLYFFCGILHFLQKTAFFVFFHSHLFLFSNYLQIVANIVCKEYVLNTICTIERYSRLRIGEFALQIQICFTGFIASLWMTFFVFSNWQSRLIKKYKYCENKFVFLFIQVNCFYLFI